MSIKSPKSEAKRLIKQYQISEIPVDVASLCSKLGIELYRANFYSLEQKIGRNISGLIQKTPDGNCVILVNENDVEVRQRFTIAHEIGHYFLHMPEEQSNVITSFRGDRSPRETEADAFAAELLMPYELLMEEYNKLVIPVVESLAKKFAVSKQAMQIRLERLELLYV